MIEEYAVVIGRADDMATLEVERRTACGLCGQKRGCGNSAWAKLSGHKNRTFTANNTLGANVGDSVVVGIDEHAFLKSALFLYVLPLLGLLAGAVLADVLFKNEFYVILSAIMGLVLAFLWVKRYLNRPVSQNKTRSDQYQAVILRHTNDVIDGENSVSGGCGRSKDSN